MGAHYSTGQYRGYVVTHELNGWWSIQKIKRCKCRCIEPKIGPFSSAKMAYMEVNKRQEQK